MEGEDIDLEPIAEIIAKKVYFRGAQIKPRVIFDIAAAAKSHRKEVVDALRMYKDDVAATLAAIDRLNPDFVHATIAALAIKAEFQVVAHTALDGAKELLGSV